MKKIPHRKLTLRRATLQEMADTQGGFGGAPGRSFHAYCSGSCNSCGPVEQCGHIVLYVEMPPG